MVLVFYILENSTSILQTKFRNRERHEARRIGLEPMPLDQHIESGCEFHELMRLRERSIKHLQPFFILKNATGDIICCDRVDFYTN